MARRGRAVTGRTGGIDSYRRSEISAAPWLYGSRVSAVTSQPTRRRLRVALPVALLGVVLVSDALIDALDPPVGPGLAALDEPAHLATAALVLLNLGSRSRVFAISLLVASVAIDIDHLPGELGSSILTAGTTRPYTHSLLGAVAIAAVAYLISRRREVAAGVGVGLLAHLVRDVATGGGVALLWPFSDAGAQVPHGIYVVFVTALAVRASLHASLTGRDGSRW